MEGVEGFSVYSGLLGKLFQEDLWFDQLLVGPVTRYTVYRIPDSICLLAVILCKVNCLFSRFQTSYHYCHSKILIFCDPGSPETSHAGE